MGEIPNYTLQAPPSLQLHTEHFNPTMLYYGIFVVGVAVFILSVYHCLVVKCCTDRPPWAGPFTGPGPSPEDQDKDHVEVVSTTVKYRKGSGGGVDECVVCLSMFEEGEEVRELPRCNHSFHAPCIDKWLYYHFVCPLCRAPVAVPVANHVGDSLTTIPGPTV